jgi:hypothetical protein
MDLMEYQTVRLIYKEEKRLKAFFLNYAPARGGA